MRKTFAPERSPASANVRCSAFGREPGEGRAGWQDKSREVRGTGSDAGALILRGIARGAIFACTFYQPITISNCTLFRTSHGSPHAS